MASCKDCGYEFTDRWLIFEEKYTDHYCTCNEECNEDTDEHCCYVDECEVE